MHSDNVTIIAAWLVQGATLGRLLRSHGQEEHAHNLEAAISELRNIVAGRIGAVVLAELMDDFSDDVWEIRPSDSVPGSREIH